MVEVSLEFLGEMMRRMLEKQDRMEAELRSVREDITVLTGIVIRLEGRNDGLPIEVRGIRERQERLIREVDRIKERLVALESADRS